jgi:hypothetical protein
MTSSIAARDREGVRVCSKWNQHRSRLFAVATFLSIIGLASQAPAASQGVQFTSQVSSPTGISTDKKVLSSKISVGLSAIADITSGSNYNVTAEAPSGFSVGPSDSALNTTFAARFSGIDVFRGRTFAERSGSSAVTLRTGISITRLNVHLIATRTGSQFPSGTYEGTVVVRCE